MPPERIDFSGRAAPSELAEWMDEPCTYAEFRACLIDLAQVNRWTLAYRPTLRWLDGVVRRQPLKKPLHIVDVGCGGGDMLRRVAAWAKRRKIEVSLTGIDLNPFAAQAAREFTPPAMAIQWITGDAFSYAPSEGIDIVLSSLFTHHLSEPEIVRFVAWMESVTSRGWFINDLRRTRTSFHLFTALARTARWHRFVQHDGPVSIRRAFCEADWQRMMLAAGLAPDTVNIERRLPWRLCVGHVK